MDLFTLFFLPLHQIVLVDVRSAVASSVTFILHISYQ